MATTKAQAAKPMEFRQRRPRPTANPVVSNKPDIFLEFNTSKLGIRVRGGDDKQGLYVAAVTNEAPLQAKDKIVQGSQIISVNEHNLENTPFDQAVEYFAQLTLPIQVRFRPPLYPPKNNNNNNNNHGHHHHDHDHHHHHNDDDDDQEGTCYIACYMILFVISFMILVSTSLNGFPGIPTKLPSMPRLFPDKSRSGRYRKSRDRLQQNTKINQQNDNNNKKGRKLLDDVIDSDMNNIHNILNNVEMNLYDDNIDNIDNN